ncbi:hypothetical protein FB45DRAFT_1104324 [Roridomyces roridus]|uniref:Uncharacterized protein n=1 Tax=Roridomyces roridus TaxID=1738132 RepID=A0AAD7BCK6_9AGAR|nr:hypothetical protein FB45DRAFT_1104324 [Roridomyces roridus]
MGRTSTEPDPQGSGFWIFLTGAAIACAILLITAGVLVEVFVIGTYHLEDSHRAILTTAPLNRILTIAHWSSNIFSMTVPVTIGLSAYLFAGRWLRASRGGDVNMPTPYQLALMIRTLKGAGLVSLWNSASYIVGRGSAPNLARPPILRSSVSLVVFLLVLGYALSGVENWLGATSTSILYPITTPLPNNGTQFQFSRQVRPLSFSFELTMAGTKSLGWPFFNQFHAFQVQKWSKWLFCVKHYTQCPKFSYQCGLIAGSGGNGPAQAPRYNTMNGVSNSTVIAFTDDATAIMVPPALQLDSTIGYRANALGVKATCTSVTTQCVNMTNTGPDAFLLTNCPQSVNFNTTASRLFGTPALTGCNPFGTNDLAFGGPLDGSGNLLDCATSPNSSEFRFGLQVQSQAYRVDRSMTEDTPVGDTGFFIHGNKGAWNVLTCDVKSLNVTYHYFNSSYTLLGSEPTNIDQTWRVEDGSWAAVYYGTAPIDGTGLYSGNYTQAFAKQLSSISLAMTAYVVEEAPVLESESTVTYIGSRLPLAPFLLLILIPSIYASNIRSIGVALITLLAVVEHSRSPHAEFARGILIEPAAAVSAAWGPEEARLAPMRTMTELFGDETSADRLVLAVDRVPDGWPVVRRRRAE